MKPARTFALALSLVALATPQVTYERLLRADAEPQNWMTYSGSYKGWRYSPLDQVNRSNVGTLKVAWVYQMPITERIETTPLVVDGVMYFSEPPSNVVALDAATGRHVVDALLDAADRAGAALLVTTHDPRVAERLSTHWVMEDGRLHTPPTSGAVR